MAHRSNKDSEKIVVIARWAAREALILKGWSASAAPLVQWVSF
jgi:hypothetical protein